MKKCDECGKEFIQNESIFTAVGVYICRECNEKLNGVITLDMVLNKIVQERINIE